MELPGIESLAAAVRGQIIRPDDPRYDSARAVYNAMHDRRPALIVQAEDTADVVATVNFARRANLLLAVRGGGHSVPGHGTCDAGVVLDLGRMNAVLVNAQDRQVRVGGGATLGDLDHATHAYGLAVPGGTVSTTGLAGLTLGGGMGHLSRHHGLSCDNLLGAEVVTAAGEIINCSKERHPDLFWAIRGGGGNFGVVTAFRFRAHRVPAVLGGPTMFRIDGQTLRNYEAFIKDAPHALNVIFALALSPPAPFVPEEWHHRPVMIALTCWSGDEDQDDSIPGMLADLGDVVGQGLWRMPYPEMNMFFDELLPPGLRHYWKASTARSFPAGAVAAQVEFGARVTNPESGNFIFPINGACHELATEESAFANRESEFSAVIAGTWHHPHEDEAMISWVRDYHAALEPYSDPGGYVNFMGDEQQVQNLDGAFGAKLQRLREVKAQYDPDNLFRVNVNIRP